MDATQAYTIIQSLTSADIITAYSGRPGCACGCRGKYYASPENREANEKRQGYKMSDDEVSVRSVTRILRQVQSAACTPDLWVEDLNKVDRDHIGWNVADDLQYATVTVSPNRVYTVYLMPEARKSRGITQGYDL